MQTVLIWAGWIYLLGLIRYSIPFGVVWVFRATLTPETKAEIDTVATGAIYLATLGWPLNLLLMLYIRIEAAKLRRHE